MQCHTIYIKLCILFYFTWILIHLPLLGSLWVFAARWTFSSLFCSFISLRTLFLSSASFFRCSFCASFSRFFSSFSCRSLLLSALVNTREDGFVFWVSFFDGGVGGWRKRVSRPTDLWDLANVVIPVVKGTKVPRGTCGMWAKIVASGWWACSHLLYLGSIVRS